MPSRKVHVADELPPKLAAGLAAIRSRLSVPAEFPPAVTAAAGRAAASPRWPELDRTDLELLTIDPPGSRDLDQALHIARDGSGYVVSYAIADVAAFVAAGDPVDAEAHRRGETLYAPDHRTPLHPPELSEGAASLLPDQVRPALLWTITLDERGEQREVSVVRARVRSRAQLDYASAQAEIDGGSARSVLALLAEVGRRREQLEAQRGGVSLQIPSQEVEVTDAGWVLTYRATQPVEGWNAQISLLTGMAAAGLMIAGRVGILRTLPAADPGSLRRLRQTAKGLGIAWPKTQSYPEFVRSLDPAKPADAAMLNACTTLFRGAGYAAFDQTLPEQTEHAALATAYAHVTAPLRRLVDRYAGEVCVALCARQPVPDWVRTALPGLPDEMAAADGLAHSYDRAVIDLIEVFLLADRVGEVLTGTIVDVDDNGRRGQVVIADPAVQGRVHGEQLPLGKQVQVRLVSADWEKPAVEFELVTSQP